MSQRLSEKLLAEARSFLFVPGDRPDRFNKAASSGADVIILDLEDAVPMENKDAARDLVKRWLDDGGRALLRLNGADTPWFDNDIQLCRHTSLLGAMLPKAQAGEALEFVAQTCATVALIETAKATRQLDRIAAVAGVVRLAFGSIDLALDLGFRASDEALDPLRLELVAASRAADIASPIGGVTTEFREASCVLSDARREAALGFGGKLCIHPAQVSPVHEALRPAASEVDRARRIIAAFNAAGEGAAALDGKMLDKPVIEGARRILAAAERLQGG